jgi:hypothetical protein
MKFFITFITALLITGIATAQHANSPAGHINIGIKGGVNIYNIHNDNDTKYDSKGGYHIGMLGHIHFDSNFAVQPEIVYSTQGATSSGENGNAKYNLNYFNIPVLFQYMFDNGFRLQAGPQVGFLMNAKLNTNDITTDIKSDLNPLEFGVSFGASYIFPPTGFGVDIRYNLGLSNINKDDSVNSFNRGLQLGIFYIFGYNSKKILQ